MKPIPPTESLPVASSGFSVLLAERVLRQADACDLPDRWTHLAFGNPSRRTTAYTVPQRLSAVLAGLACGLHGIGPGNSFLRPNAALQARLAGRFPDQGTIHRWLQQVTADQASHLRDHLHQVVHDHGRFREVLYAGGQLVVDVDGQGLVARGGRFEKATRGYLGEGLDKGYIRYVAYAADTHEVLDEFLAPGNKTLMSQLPTLVAGLNAVIPKRQRPQVLVRGDAHLGTIGNLRDLRHDGYHYLCPLQSWAAGKRLREQIRGAHGGYFTSIDSNGLRHRVQFWVVKRWLLNGKGRQRKVVVRATVYHERDRDGPHQWSVLVSDLKRQKGPGLWKRYHERGGTIEEYNDQAERAYHLEVVRTGHYEGLQALQVLVGLCWNLTRWATEELRLPPVQGPQAARGFWQAASGLDLAGLQQRAAHSGLRLYRESPGAVLEVLDTAGTPESAAWQAWLKQPIQILLLLTG